MALYDEERAYYLAQLAAGGISTDTPLYDLRKMFYAAALTGNVIDVYDGQSLQTAVTVAAAAGWDADDPGEIRVYDGVADLNYLLPTANTGIRVLAARNGWVREAWVMAAERHAKTTDLNLHILKSHDGVSFKNVKTGATDHVFAGKSDGGVIEPALMYYRGSFYCVYRQGVDHTLEVAVSADLITWTDLVTLTMVDEDRVSVNSPNWFTDSDGSVHILAGLTDEEGGAQLAEIHPDAVDPATWGNAANWSVYTTIDDDQGVPSPVVGLHPAIVKINGVYHLVYGEEGDAGPVWCVSASLVTGYALAWDAASPYLFGAGTMVAPGIATLADRRQRIYCSSLGVIYYIETVGDDLNSWGALTAATLVGCTPAMDHGKAIRVTDPTAIALIMSAAE
jgi:hypothetical protein